MRPKAGRKTPKAKGPGAARVSVVRIAEQLGVGVNDWERAQILGQVAALLIADPRIGNAIAFKGGAITHLIDGSARLSGDLDVVVVSGRPLRASWTRAALETPAAKRVVLGLGKIVNTSAESLDIPFIECKSLSGHGKVTVRLQISWRHPPLEAPVMETIRVAPRNESVRLPVLSRPERAAEKVRAFLERGLPRDAFDLNHYAGIPGFRPNAKLGRFIQQKLVEGDLPDETDLHARFEDMLDAARQAWGRPGSMVLTAQAPDWATVERNLRSRFKAFVPATLHRP